MWEANSRRRAELPSDWSAIRRAVLERDGYACQLADPDICAGRSSAVAAADNRPE